jgi:hypothetical protein
MSNLVVLSLAEPNCIRFIVDMGPIWGWLGFSFRCIGSGLVGLGRVVVLNRIRLFCVCGFFEGDDVIVSWLKAGWD